MRYVVQFVVGHEGCSIDDIRNAFPEEDLSEIEAAVRQADEAGYINANITRTDLLEGPVFNFGFIFPTPAGRALLERGAPRWRG